MAVPATTGSKISSIQDMKIGDYIICKYVATAGAVGIFSEIGTSTVTEIAVTGSNAPNGAFYFVKVAKGLLVADRNIQHSISWDVLNAGKIIQGKPTTLGGIIGNIRILAGGVAYADSDGNSSSATNNGFGAFPTNNEYDKYIMNFPADRIQVEGFLDDVFHMLQGNNWCLTQGTPTLSWVSSDYRICRSGKLSSITRSNGVSAGIGFRPVFAYNENQFAQ